MKPETRSTRPPQSPMAWPTSDPATASCTPSTWRTARRSGSTRRPRTASASLHRPWLDGLVYIGDLSAGTFHAVDVDTGKAAWTFKTGSEVKSSPVVVRRQGPDRLLRLAPVRARREGRQARLEGSDRGLRPCDAGGHRRRRLHRRLRRDPARHSRRRRQGSVPDLVWCLHRRVAGDPRTAAPTTAPTRTRCSASTSRRTRSSGDTSTRSATFPFHSSPAISGDRVFVGGRDKMLHALDLNSGKAIWTFTTRARIDSSPGGRRQPRRSRQQRRQALCRRRRHRQEHPGVRSRRPAQRVPGDRRRQARHRFR